MSRWTDQFRKNLWDLDSGWHGMAAIVVLSLTIAAAVYAAVVGVVALVSVAPGLAIPLLIGIGTGLLVIAIGLAVTP